MKAFIPDQKMLKRFWSKVNVRCPDECWTWMGCKDKLGYGYIAVDKIRDGIMRIVRASRVSMMISLGRWLSSEEHVLHNCPGKDNPSCVNPAHLRIGTHQDNMKDVVRKHQSPRGEEHCRSKLTNSEVRSMRRKRTRGWTMQRLADFYGLCIATVFDIIHVKSYKDA